MEATSELPREESSDLKAERQEANPTSISSSQPCDCAREGSQNKDTDGINRFIVIAEDGNKLKVTTIKIPVDVELSSAVVQETVANQESAADSRQTAAAAPVETNESAPVEPKPEESAQEKPTAHVVASTPAFEDLKSEEKEPEQETVKKETSEAKKQKNTKQKKEGKRSKRDIKLKTKSKESWKNKLNNEKKNKGKNRK